MLYLKNELSVKCNRCGSVMQIDSDNFMYTSIDYERNMGTEVEYDFSTEIPCPECQNDIAILIRGFEYPVGALDHSDYECDGGELLESPDLEVEYEPDGEIEVKEDNATMYIHELVKRCDEDYVRNASKYVCKDCSHIGKCPGNCGKCLDEVHLSRGENERKDYDCNYMMDCYVGRYMYAYVSENKKAFEIVESGIRRLPYIHMLSIGCGPSPDLFGIIDFLKENSIEKTISYIGFEHNEKWAAVHNNISDILTEEAKIQFFYQDAFETFREKMLPKTNILIMQYLLSHVVYNQRQSEIDEFFDNLVEHVIMKMESKSYIIINDINHNLARDRFELLEKKIERKGKKIKVYKYYFRYKPDLNVFQTAGMVRHESNTIDYFIEPCIQERYGARMDCRSVQHIIEVDDL